LESAARSRESKKSAGSSEVWSELICAARALLLTQF
jgi:hypothetical protein